jgi:uncharacterized repeat protein (TIGR03803 family)
MPQKGGDAFRISFLGSKPCGQECLLQDHAQATGISNLLILHTTAVLTTDDPDPGTDLDMKTGKPQRGERSIPTQYAEASWTFQAGGVRWFTFKTRKFMTKPLQDRGSVSGTRRRAANALGLAALALLLMVATQSVRAQTFTLVYAFQGKPDGKNPFASLMQDSSGTFYGTTAGGGGSNNGTIFKLSPTGQESVLFSFGPIGSQPLAGVAEDSAGNFYGTTNRSGKPRLGIVYKLNPNGVLTVLHAFTGGADGEYPVAGVVLDGVGNIYGVTPQGGATAKCPKCSGIVFKVNKAGKYSILHRFSPSDAPPVDGLLWSQATGFLYGATGATIYQMTTTGKETVLYRSNTLNPTSGLMQDAAGNFYGTAAGIVYRLDTQQQETVLYTFTGPPDGSDPKGGVVQDAAGNLYGTTQLGGLGGGTVFKLAPNGDGTYAESVMHSFTGADGAYPQFPLILDLFGNLFGTAPWGGTVGGQCFSDGCGTVFEVTP